MSRIPHDVVTDIFQRLPVKSLLRFRCLSKLLCALIDGPCFVQLHLAHSLKTKSNLGLILKDWNLYTVDFDSLDTAVDLNNPLPGGTEAVGSCNGLVVLRNTERDLAIYNLATRKVKRLPVFEIEPPGDCLKTGYVFYGFGYDLGSDDYKLVRMAQFNLDNDDCEPLDCNFEVQIYSLKRNSWKRMKDLPYYLRFLHKPFHQVFHRRGYGVLASCAVHWVLPKRPQLGIKDFVVAFDFGTESFREVPQPEYGTNALNLQVDVGVLEGCLCVMCNYHLQSRVDVWVMKEYGVKESWTKLLSFERSKTISDLVFLRPLSYSKDGEKVLLEVNDGKLVWYDFNRRTTKSVKINKAPKTFGAEMYVGSLISLDDDGESQQCRNQEREEREKTTTHRKKMDDFLSVGFKLKL